jgi:serine/threonine-protein kinase RsbW
MNDRAPGAGSDPDPEIAVEIPSRLDELCRVEQLAQRVARRFRLSHEQTDNLAIAMTEAVGNAIVHGNAGDASKTVRIAYRRRGGCLCVDVADQGTGFDPDGLLDPLAPENILKEHGRGIFILKNLMDEVRFSFTPSGTVVHMKIRLGERST